MPQINYLFQFMFAKEIVNINSRAKRGIRYVRGEYASKGSHADSHFSCD